MDQAASGWNSLNTVVALYRSTKAPEELDNEFVQSGNANGLGAAIVLAGDETNMAVSTQTLSTQGNGTTNGAISSVIENSRMQVHTTRSSNRVQVLYYEPTYGVLGF